VSYTTTSTLNKLWYSSTHNFDMQQPTATHSNPQQHDATHCIILRDHTLILPFSDTPLPTLFQKSHSNILQQTTTYHNSLQHIAPHCSTLQHHTLIVSFSDKTFCHARSRLLRSSSESSIMACLYTYVYICIYIHIYIYICISARPNQSSIFPSSWIDLTKVFYLSCSINI